MEEDSSNHRLCTTFPVKTFFLLKRQMTAWLRGGDCWAEERALAELTQALGAGAAAGSYYVWHAGEQPSWQPRARAPWGGASLGGGEGCELPFKQGPGQSTAQEGPLLLVSPLLGTPWMICTLPSPGTWQTLPAPRVSLLTASLQCDSRQRKRAGCQLSMHSEQLSSFIVWALVGDA